MRCKLFLKEFSSVLALGLYTDTYVRVRKFSRHLPNVM